MSTSPAFPSINPRTARPIVLATLAATLSFVSLPLIAQGSRKPSNPAAQRAAAQSAPGAKPSQSDIANGGRPETESDIEASANAAADFVPAQAILTDTLDAKKLQPGANFEAKLDSKVKLPDGAELPSGTLLKGTVATDDLNVQGNSKLVLRFTSAQLKNGQYLPVHATIVGFEAPGNQESMAYSGYEEPQPNDWSPATRAVDQIGVTSGVDLHSKLDSQNSGVFVTTSKDDVKLKRGSAVNLAIAPAEGAQPSAGE